MCVRELFCVRFVKVHFNRVGRIRIDHILTVFYLFIVFAVVFDIYFHII